MSTVSAFRLHDRYFIHPNKRTTTGLHVAQPDFTCLPLNATVEAIGSAILVALDQSQGVVPHPSDWTALSKPRLAAAGVRSERAFMAGAKLVEVDRDENFRLEPTRNGRSSGDARGFARLQDGQVSLSLHSSPKTIGEAFLKVLEECAVET